MATETQSQDELRELYRELILDHARSPRHFGKLNGATHSAEGINPLCGDKLKVYFDIDADQQIQDARFEGSGCAISVASASLLTDTVIGLTTASATDFFSAFVTLLGGQAASNDSGDVTVDLGKLKALAGVREFPSRVKCATLAWHALNSAIRQDPKPVSTE